MKTNDVNLTDLMNDIDRGKIQLPDFQRSWIWDKNQVRYLIASVLNHDPIGALMFWEYGNNDIFNYRTIEGAPSNELVVPKKLILDGQQRLTSIYRAFFRQSPVIEKNSKGYTRHYVEAVCSDGGSENEILKAKVLRYVNNRLEC